MSWQTMMVFGGAAILAIFGKDHDDAVACAAFGLVGHICWAIDRLGARR